MRCTTAVAVLGLSLVLAGCGVIPGIGPDPRVEATPVATVACPETYEEGYAEGGLVPPGFTAVAVLRCDPYASREDGDGIWSGALLQRLEGDLEPVLTALATPSDPRSLGPCTTIGYVSPELWMEGADGRMVRVAIPSDGCGAPKATGLESALDALTMVEETFTPLSLIESTAAKDAGCASQAGMLVLAGLDEVSGEQTDAVVPDAQGIGEDALIPYELPGWPDASAVNGARLCDYVTTVASTNPPALTGNDGVFVGTRELAAAEAKAVIAYARLAPAAPSCSDVATKLVVVQPSLASGDTPPFTVELDGCQRVVDPSFHARIASEELLALLSTEG